MRLLVGTNNPGKVLEVEAVLNGLNVSLITPRSLDLTLQPDETGMTYAENALIKARAFFEHSQKMPTVAEDAGIVVDAFPGELGIHTRRWGLGPTVTDHEWITYFLERMKGIPNRRATFFSVVAFIDTHGKEHLFEGTCAGTITETLETEVPLGLPFDACFRPDNFDVVYGALTREQKNTISHRGSALQKFRTHLSQYLPRTSA